MMWDPNASIILRLCLLSLIYLTIIDCSHLPPTKTPARKAFEEKHQPIKPIDLLEKRNSLLGSIKLSNQEFCTEMLLQPEDYYLVLPWWYTYCEDLRKKYKHGLIGNVNLEEIRKYMMSEAVSYRERLLDKNIKLSDLEKELIEYNRRKM